MSKIKAIKLTQGVNAMEFVEIESDDFLDECYKHINCRCIDIVTGSYKGEYVDIVVDDEGLLKDTTIINPIAWYLYSKCDKDYLIVGNAILVGTNEDGETIDVPQLFIDERDDIIMSVFDQLYKLLI